MRSLHIFLNYSKQAMQFHVVIHILSRHTHSLTSLSAPTPTMPLAPPHLHYITLSAFQTTPKVTSGASTITFLQDNTQSPTLLCSRCHNHISHTRNTQKTPNPHFMCSCQIKDPQNIVYCFVSRIYKLDIESITMITSPSRLDWNEQHTYCCCSSRILPIQKLNPGVDTYRNSTPSYCLFESWSLDFSVECISLHFNEKAILTTSDNASQPKLKQKCIWPWPRFKRKMHLT